MTTKYTDGQVPAASNFNKSCPQPDPQKIQHNVFAPQNFLNPYT